MTYIFVCFDFLMEIYLNINDIAHKCMIYLAEQSIVYTYLTTDVVKPDHYACENKFLDLKCPKGLVIKVNAANYGRSVRTLTAVLFLKLQAKYIYAIDLLWYENNNWLLPLAPLRTEYCKVKISE